MNARRHFQLSLADQEPVFWDGGSVLAQQLHKDWPAPTAWAIGSSAICAKFILDLIPRKHVRRSEMRYRDEPDMLLANIVEISEAAYLVFNWGNRLSSHRPVARASSLGGGSLYFLRDFKSSGGGGSVFSLYSCSL